MSRVSADFKSLLIQGIKWDADDAGISLGAALKIAARARLSETAAGKVLIGTDRSGHSVTFALPSNGRGMSPQDATELISRLLNLYKSTIATLQAADADFDPDSKDTNDVVLSTMLADSYFTAIRRFGTDHSGMMQEPCYA